MATSKRKKGPKAADSFAVVAARMVRWYPTLFRCRARILNHLFCTIGNGYEWRGGGLTDGDATDAERQAEFDQQAEWAVNYDREMRARFASVAEQHNLSVPPEPEPVRERPATDDEIAAVLADCDHPHKIRSEEDRIHRDLDGLANRLDSVFYPIGQFSRCMTVPDDVQPDWLAAVREAMQMVIRWDIPDQVARAQQVLADLERRFGADPGNPDWPVL